MTFVFGALCSAIHGEVYKIYEGRILWPRRLLELALGNQRRQLARYVRKRDETKDLVPDTRYREAWYQLRLYPVNAEGEQIVERPTLLGNILAGYEDYPMKRYGMDPVFFWPRIWLQLEKEKKEEIDNSWSVADGFLSLSAVSFLGGALWLWLPPRNLLTLASLSLPLSDWRHLHAAAQLLAY